MPLERESRVSQLTACHADERAVGAVEREKAYRRRVFLGSLLASNRSGVLSVDRIAIRVPRTHVFVSSLVVCALAWP